MVNGSLAVDATNATISEPNVVRSLDLLRHLHHHHLHPHHHHHRPTTTPTLQDPVPTTTMRQTPIPIQTTMEEVKSANLCSATRFQPAWKQHKKDGNNLSDTMNNAHYIELETNKITKVFVSNNERIIENSDIISVITPLCVDLQKIDDVITKKRVRDSDLVNMNCPPQRCGDIE